MIDSPSYEPYDTLVDRPLHEVDRATARAEYDRLMAARAGRREALRRLVADEAGVDLDGSDQAVRALEEWLRSAVSEDEAQPGRAAPIWYAVALDVALYLGDLLVERHADLEWTLCTTSPRDLGYHRAVIAGFADAVPDYYADLGQAVAMHVTRLARGLPVPEGFLVSILRSNDPEPDG